MTFKRKLDIATPIDSARYDNLRKFYVSKGVREPVRSDNSLQVSDTQQGSIVRWSLGGWQQQNESIPKTPSQKQMDEWVDAHKTNDEAFTSENNDYLASHGDQTISLPYVFSQLRENTMDKILNDSASILSERLIEIPTYEAGELTEEARAFYGAILATAKVDEPLYDHAYKMLRFREVRTRIQEEIDSLDRQIVITKETIRLALDAQDSARAELYQTRLSGQSAEKATLQQELRTFGSVAYPNLDKSFRLGTLYLYAGLGAEIFQDKVALYNAVRAVEGDRTILNILKGLAPSDRTIYDAIKIREETPFITRSEMHPILDSSAGLKTEKGISQVNPEYLFYDSNYEQTISGSNIPENVHPNMYIYDLYTSTIIKDGLVVHPAWQGDLTKGATLYHKEYGPSATLVGNIPEGYNLLNNRSLRDYLDVYSVKATCNLTDGQKSYINNLMNSVMFPATEMDTLQDLEEKKKFFPMYIQTSFATSEQGEVGKIIEKYKSSSTVLEALYTNDGIEHRYQVQSDLYVPYSEENLLVANLVPIGIRPLKVTNIFDALKFGFEKDEVIQSIVISKKGEEPVTRQKLSVSQIESLQKALLNVRNEIKPLALSYSDYFDVRTESPSEALGYKLSKIDQEGTKIQDILFFNTGESRTVTYVDTQVKYDIKYRYELSEFRLVVGTEYELYVLDAATPVSLTTTNPSEIPDSVNPSNIYYDITTLERPIVQVVEVPIYGSFFDNPDMDTENMAFSVEYPHVNIMDHPPSPPDLQVLPLLNNYREILLNTQIGTGNYTGDHALEVISFIFNDQKLQSLYEYQKQFENFDLKPGRLEYKNEGIEEIRKVFLLRTQALNLSVPKYNDLYASFADEEAEVRILSLDPADNVETVVSFDILDTLDTNVYYYYTCYVEDVHGNPSLPSPIYRVRLVYEKGLFIPEIELFNYKPISTQVPTRKLARFMRVEASDIQTFPFFDLDPDGVIQGTKNLASVLGSPVVGNTFVFRLTSRDTGRKIDLKLSFDEKVPQEEDENTPCND
jgi:hypothetical protein